MSQRSPTDVDAPRAWERIVPIVVALLGLAWGTMRALGVGYPDASGIVEEPLGGAGTAALLAMFFIGVPSVAVGVVDGLTVRVRRRATRVGTRIVLVGGFGVWSGLWIWGFTDIDCDGTCLDADTGIVVTTLLAAVVFLAVEIGIATVVGRAARRRDAARAGTGTVV